MSYIHSQSNNLSRDFELVMVYYPFDMACVLNHTNQSEADVIENIANFSYRCSMNELPIDCDESEVLIYALNCGSSDGLYFDMHAEYYIDYNALFSDNIDLYEYDNYDPNDGFAVDGMDAKQIAQAFTKMHEILYYGFICDLDLETREILEENIPCMRDFENMERPFFQPLDYFELVGDLIRFPFFYPKKGLDNVMFDNLFKPQERKQQYFKDISQHLSESNYYPRGR